MKKPDEITFYAAINAHVHLTRCYALLHKWSYKGWWNYGINVRHGWFTPEAPERIEPNGP